MVVLNKQTRGGSLIAHISEVVGKFSEMAARLALMANGWTTHRSDTDEAYDVLAQDPLTNEYVRIQVKTIRQRFDRGNELVVCAKKGNGEIYTKSDADYIVGVLATEGELPRVWIFENREIGEYWASEARASERWIELPLTLNRSLYVEAA